MDQIVAREPLKKEPKEKMMRSGQFNLALSPTTISCSRQATSSIGSKLVEQHSKLRMVALVWCRIFLNPAFLKVLIRIFLSMILQNNLIYLTIKIKSQMKAYTGVMNQRFWMPVKKHFILPMTDLLSTWVVETLLAQMLQPITSTSPIQIQETWLPYAPISLISIQVKPLSINAPHWRVKLHAVWNKKLVLLVASGKRLISVSKVNNGRKSNLYLTLPRRGTPPRTTCKEQLS